MPESAPAIQAENLVKMYGSFRAVKGIDFEVPSGVCFGFLGPNGAGKTTVMKMIYGVNVVTGGRLEILGLDPRESAREIKRRIGVVPQEESLDLELTVEENLIIYARYFDLVGEPARERVTELLDFFGLTEKTGAPVETLSGGMKRRLLLARGLLNRPEIVILDEPTTGLDPQARHSLWDRMRALRTEGVTLLLTTHYMAEAEQLCDRLVLMDQGEIVARGTPKGLVEAHLPPDVLALRLPPGEEGERLVGLLGDEAEEVRRTRDFLLLFTADGESLFDRLTELDGISAGDILSRGSNLEDVFLKLTGHALSQ